MPTNDERREVADGLRRQVKRLGPQMDAHEFAHYGADVIDSDNEILRWDQMMLRLADLIEPEERTCRNIADETYREFGEPFKCSECGADPHDGENFFCGFSSGEHDWRFCPNCGARVVRDA